MNKEISWKVLLLIGAVCWILARVLGGVVGNAIGMLADILLLVSIITGITKYIKSRSKPKV